MSQYSNAASPILVTLSGIVIDVRLLHLLNANPLMLVTPSGSEIAGSFSQFANADPPTLVTPSGIVIETRFLQLENVWVAIFVTFFGIVNEVMPDGYIVMEQRNKFLVGDEVEIMKKNGENDIAIVLAMKDEQGNQMESCPHPKQKIFVKFSVLPEEFDIIRQKAIEE